MMNDDVDDDEAVVDNMIRRRLNAHLMNWIGADLQ